MDALEEEQQMKRKENIKAAVKRTRAEMTPEEQDEYRRKDCILGCHFEVF